MLSEWVQTPTTQVTSYPDSLQIYSYHCQHTAEIIGILEAEVGGGGYIPRGDTIPFLYRLNVPEILTQSTPVVPRVVNTYISGAFLQLSRGQTRVRGERDHPLQP